MHIGQKIKRLAESKKMTPIEFSALLGKKSRGTAYDVWQREDINTKELKIIAAHFEVPISYFFGETSEKPSTKNGVIEPRAEYGHSNTDELVTALRYTIDVQKKLIIELEKSKGVVRDAGCADVG